MHQEIEVKFLNIDIEQIRDKLEKSGAKLLVPMRLMRRVVLDFPDRSLQATKDSWLRIRDEGDKTTLTYKTAIENVFGGAKELETIVESYETTIAIFQKLGMQVFSDQETKRETWTLDGAEVVIDIWPWLNPFIEVEGPCEEDVKRVSKKLAMDWDNAVFGTVTTAYRKQFPLITKDEHISMLPEIKFNIPMPKWFTKEAVKF